jgi:hypothetical protein
MGNLPRAEGRGAAQREGNSECSADSSAQARLTAFKVRARRLRAACRRVRGGPAGWRLVLPQDPLTNEDGKARDDRRDEGEDGIIAASRWVHGHKNMNSCYLPCIYPVPKLVNPVAQGHGAGVSRIIGEGENSRCG